MYLFRCVYKPSNMLTVDLVEHTLDPADSSGDNSKKPLFVLVDHVGTSGGNLEFV